MEKSIQIKSLFQLKGKKDNDKNIFLKKYKNKIKVIHLI